MVEPPVRLRLLGLPEICHKGCEQTVPVVDKPWALLFYLAVERGPRGRGDLASLLWPDKDPRAGRVNLSATLYTLGRWFGPALPLEKALESLGFSVDSPEREEDPVDVVRFFSDRPPGACDRLHAAALCPDCRSLVASRLALCRGTFLEGALLPAPEPYLRWVETVRKRVSARKEELLARLGPAAPAAPGSSFAVPVLSGSLWERRQITLLSVHLSASPEMEAEDRIEGERDFRASAESLLRDRGAWLIPSVEIPLLAVFGYPHVREDGAQAALDAARALIRAFRALAPPSLEIRMGLHTGEGTVDHLRGSPDATGDRAIEAGRVAREAPSGEVIASKTTVRLLAKSVRALPLGKKIPDQSGGFLDLFLLTGEEALESGSDRLLVGRDEELSRLRDLWLLVARGKAQTVWITGEAGIGKSALAGAFSRAVETGADRPAGALREYRCRAGAREIPWDPVVRFLRGRMRFDEGRRSLSERRYRAERLLLSAGLPVADNLPTLLHLLEGPGLWSKDLLSHAPDSLRRRIETLLEDLFSLPEGGLPLLLVVEDLHWADHSTISLLRKWQGRRETPPVLLVLTAREEAALSGRDLPPPDLVLPLRRLDRGAGRLLVESVSGGRLKPDRLREVLDLGGGVPLFLRELARPGSGPEERLPATLRDLLSSRLGDLGEDRGTLEVAACLLGPFSLSLLSAAISEREGGPLDPEEVEERLRRLSARGLLERDREGEDPVWDFSHALLREAVLASLPPKFRRSVHRLLAHTLQNRFPERVAREPEILADHLALSGDHPGAVEEWIRAAKLSASLGAVPDALADLEKALGLLRKERDHPGARARELEILLAMGPLSLAVHGYGSRNVEEIYGRAYDLCREEEASCPFPVLLGVCAGAFTRSGPAGARSFLERLEQRAREAESPESCRALARVGAVRFFEGRLAEADRVLLEVSALLASSPDRSSKEGPLPPYAEDPFVSALSYLSFSAQIAGRPDEAIWYGQKAWERVRDIDHPYSAGFAATFSAYLHIFRGDRPLAAESAVRSIALSEKYGYRQWETMGRLALAWSRPDRASALEAREKVAQLREMVPGIMPIFVLPLAETALLAGLPEMALEELIKGQAEAEKSGTALFNPELLRLEGEATLLLEPAGNHKRAEALFRKARDGAEKGGAAWFALRAGFALFGLCPTEGDFLRRTLSRIRDGRGLPLVGEVRQALFSRERGRGSSGEKGKSLSE